MNEFDQLVTELSSLPEVESIALGGSRAAGKEDETSDYDLYVYCSSLPDESLRKEILEPLCSVMEISNQFWETEDDCTFHNGIDIDIIYRNPEDFFKQIDSVVFRHQAANGYTTCLWHNLLHSKILHDRNGRLRAKQKEVSISYPPKLAASIISKNRRLLSGSLPSYDRQILKASRRGDLPSVNHRKAAFLESYFDLLFALNAMTHPGEKRMIESLESAALLPEHFPCDVSALIETPGTQTDRIEEILKRMIREVDGLMQL